MEPVRFSNLKLMALSPAHYREGYVKQTACMEQGSAADAVILGTCPVLAYPGKVRRGKEWEKFRAENEGSLLVTQRELSLAEAMRDSIQANRCARAALCGERQKEIHWEYLGRECVSHLDVLGSNGSSTFISDLKVSQSSNPDKFRWKMVKMGYHAQLAFYRLAVQYLTGTKPQTAYSVAIEPSPPFVVTTMRLTEKALDLGERLVRLWFERLLACEAANEWPGYAQGVVELDAPDDVEFDFGDDSKGVDFDLNECVKASDEELIK
jgi:hypothetical protein